MYEQFAEWFWIALFAAIIIYGLSNALTEPWRVKQFYKRINFSNTGSSNFEVAPYTESLLLKAQMTRSLYIGDYRGFRVEQFSSLSKQRRKFTFSKIARKRNQQVWTVTIVALAKPLPSFCARPTFVPEATEYVLRGDAVLFPNDEEFAKRMHVVAPNHPLVRKRINAEVRHYFKGIDPRSLEVVSTYLIHKRPRQSYDGGDSLQQDLDAVVKLAIALNEIDPAVTS